MDALGTLKAAITWLGGAVAGLTVLCYGAGYFALHAYLAMLGLDAIVPVNYDQMLTEGAKFWLALISQLLWYLALALVILIVFLVPCLILQNFKPVRSGCAAGAAKVKVSWEWLTKRFPGLGSTTVLIIFLGLLSTHYDDYFLALRSLASQPVLEKKDQPPRDLPPLLFSWQPSNEPCVNPNLTDGDRLSATARDLINRGEDCREQLRNGAFNSLVRGYFLLILLASLAFSRTFEPYLGRAVNIVRLGAGFYFGLYTLSLPPAYGVLVHEPVYPHVAISGPGLTAQGYRLFQDDHGLLLWLPTARRIVWLPVDRLGLIQIDARRNIFEKPQEKGK